MFFRRELFKTPQISYICLCNPSRMSKCAVCHGRGGLWRICKQCQVRFHANCWWKWFLHRRQNETCACPYCGSCEHLALDEILPSTRVTRNQNVDYEYIELLLKICNIRETQILISHVSHDRLVMSLLQYIEAHMNEIVRQNPKLLESAAGRTGCFEQKKRDLGHRVYASEMKRLLQLFTSTLVHV